MFRRSFARRFFLIIGCRWARTKSTIIRNVHHDELMLLGKRSRNLEKAFNTLHTDLARADDMPPRRYMEEPIPSGSYKGERAKKDKWERMLDEFYDLHGWDRETGLQTRSSLTALGMADVAEKLAPAGKLIERLWSDWVKSIRHQRIQHAILLPVIGEKH